MREVAIYANEETVYGNVRTGRGDAERRVFCDVRNEIIREMKKRRINLQRVFVSTFDLILSVRVVSS